MCVLRRALLAIGFLLFCGPANAQDLDALSAQVIQLYRAGKYAQAVPIARKIVDGIRKKFGDTHPDYATAVDNLARLYQTQGRYRQAEPLFNRSLAIRERALGRDHPSVGTTLNNLAELYRVQGRFGVQTAEKNQQTEPEKKPGSRVCKQAFHVMRDGVCVDIR